MAVTRIIGFDPGTARTGYGVIERDGNTLTVVAHGLIATAAGTEAPERLKTIYEEMTKLLAAHRPDSLAIEKLFFQTNVKTAMSVAEARGVILLACAQSGLPTSEYTAQQVKQSVAGYGQADKKQVADMVCRQLGLKTVPKPDDVTDALALAICHAFWRPS